jgi:hypothetical protein
MNTEKPQTGTWTLTSPDGRTWQADCPLRCVSMELRERVPATVALERLKKFIEETDDDA